ncbi:class I SAM-dependent methyltransferase [Candidatus Methylocalor cossyra]|uniref:Class I SAM-dependent methyltransferase n=1 Tax=Candidatus Methylocalor cossyra TaxID=3108543 RepID=A0ABM9NJQ6_9GAMM
MDSSRLLKRYLSSGYKAVSGWLGPETMAQILAIHQVQQRLGISGAVGEIGVHHGKLFILLYLLASADEAAVAVDLFDAQELNIDKSGRGDFGLFTANLKHHAGDLSRLKVIGTDSTRIGGREILAATGRPLRLFSIDGGHLASIVRHDLNTAAESLGDGGVVILDDYFNPEFPGVSEGTNRFFFTDNGRVGKALVPFLIGMNKLYLTTAGRAEAFLDHFCRKDLGRPLDSVVKFDTYPTRTTTVFVTELFGATVLAYSPDRFGLGERMRRSFRAGLIRARGQLGDSALGRKLRGSGLGHWIRRAADYLAPYR